MTKEPPIIKAVKIERAKRPDGKEDVTIYVPRLAMKAAIKAHEAKNKERKQ